MPRLVFIEWDEVELRALDLKSGTKDSAVQRAFSIEFSPGSADGPSRQVADALSTANFGKADAVVCVGRSGCQLRTLTLPIVPKDELPELVRFQAMRQFSNFNNESAVDFVVLEESANHGIEVLAAVISPELMKQVEDTVERAGLNLKRIVLRPFAAAEVITKSLDSNECVLIVDRYALEADLTVVRGKSVLTTRTIRLDSSTVTPQYLQVLRGEITRTIAAAQNEIGEAEVTRIVLTGTEQECAELKSQLSESLTQTVDVVDPFVATGVKIRKMPEHPGRFASLLGTMQQHFHQSDHRVDFLNPRKKEDDNSGRQRVLIWAGIGAATLAVLLVLAWLPIYFKGKQIEFLERNVANLESSDVTNQMFSAEVRELDKWVDQEVIVLDELYYISYHLPPPEDVIVNSLHFRHPPRTENPTISITGRMSGSETVGDIENRLRDDEEIHDVSGKRVQPISGDKLYDHEFDETITIDKAKLSKRANRKPAIVVQADTKVDNIDKNAGVKSDDENAGAEASISKDSSAASKQTSKE